MSHPSIRRWAGVAATFGLLLAYQYVQPHAAVAQQTAPAATSQALLQGVVVHESTGQAVESATVSLVGTEVEVPTGKYGGFAFPDVPIGVMSVRATAPGHPSIVQEVEVKGDGIVFVRFVLPSVAAVLSELLVAVRGNIRHAGPETAADLLAIEAPNTRILTGNVGKSDYTIGLRQSATSLTSNTEPLILIDGVMISRLGQALDALTQIAASDVRSIEVLEGSEAMTRYPMAANGVVLVTTRFGGGR